MDEEEELVESWPKTCGGCGSVYDEDQWEALRYVGVQQSGMPDFPDLEMRNCSRCQSTMAIVVPNDYVKIA